MPDHTDIPLEQLLIYDDEELIFDGSDPSTYIVLKPDITDGAAALDWERELGRTTDGIITAGDADPGL